MHFTYEIPDSEDLMQGDILRRTGALDSIFQATHPQFFHKKENTHFIVLTQSCDLVRRNGTVTCDARYITLAAVRSIAYVLNSQVRANEFFRSDDDIGLCTQRKRDHIRFFFQRLYNNNESEFFFLKSEPSAGLADDSCAILRLSVPIEASLHYSTCLESRMLSLNDVFRAKLGWLVGQMYARVGTDDWPSDDMNERVDSMLDTATIWVEERHEKTLRKRIEDHRDKLPHEKIDREVLKEWVKALPRRKEQVLGVVDRVLEESDGISSEQKRRVVTRLRNDPELAALLPR